MQNFAFAFRPLFVGLEAALISKLLDFGFQKCCSTASILVACASQPMLAVVCARFATKGLVVVRECSVCVYAYVCMCACVCVHVCVHADVRKGLFVCMYAYSCVYVCVICTWVWM